MRLENESGCFSQYVTLISIQLWDISNKLPMATDSTFHVNVRWRDGDTKFLMYNRIMGSARTSGWKENFFISWNLICCHVFLSLGFLLGSICLWTTRIGITILFELWNQLQKGMALPNMDANAFFTLITGPFFQYSDERCPAFASQIKEIRSQSWKSYPHLTGKMKQEGRKKTLD